MEKAEASQSIFLFPRTMPFFFFYFTLEVNERRQCFSPISILVTSKCRNVHCVKSKKFPYENVAQNDDEPDFSGKNRKNIGYKLFPVPDSRY